MTSCFMLSKVDCMNIIVFYEYHYDQKQPPEVLCKKRFSQKSVLKKETSTQVLSYEICKIFKNVYNLKSFRERLLLYNKHQRIQRTQSWEMQRFRENRCLGRCRNKHLNLSRQTFHCNNLRWSFFRKQKW